MLATSSRKFFREFYRLIIILIGSVIILAAFYNLALVPFDWQILALLALTALVGSQISFKFTRDNSAITVADTFIFLAMLSWGAPAAILMAITESIAATTKTRNCRFKNYLFNVCAAVTGTWVTAATLNALFGDSSQSVVQLPLATFILAICAMGLVQYFAVSTILAAMQFFNLPSWESWRTWMRQYCLWSCVTFFVAAATAGLTVKFLGALDILAFLIVAPMIGLLYLTYRTYLRSHDALQESEARFRSSFDYATVGMALVSPEGYWLESNQSLRNLLARTDDELKHLRYLDVVSPEERAKVENHTLKLLHGQTPTFHEEVQLKTAFGETVWVLLSVSTARDAQYNIRHLIFQTQDITSRKRAEEQLLHEASHDALTGLLNRAALTAQLKIALKRMMRSEGKLLAVLFLDLDGFKIVNDSLGHAIGDELLQIAAARLLECVRTIDTVARIGGDEFVVLLEDVDGVEQAKQVAERIRQKIIEPFQIASQEIFVSTSIGIATSEIQYKEPGEMLRDADAAMYEAKARGKSCYVLFDHEMHANVLRQLRLVSDLRRAGERNELLLEYQPIHSLETEEIVGFEALVRWQHPVYGLLAPIDFIPLAEENGLAVQLDRWTLTEACRQMRRWQIENPIAENFFVSVNVSTKQLVQKGLYDFVKHVLWETNLSPNNLHLEITESAMASKLKDTAEILDSLGKLGISIALDDFGTGYSSLSYLSELPISALKIDCSFVSQMIDETEGAAIVRAIIVLARNLQMKVIAEGIETLDQFKQLRSMNCDYGQGFLFSRPLSLGDTFRLIKTQESNQEQTFTRKHNQLRLISNG